jgi:hypothetical protein
MTTVIGRAEALPHMLAVQSSCEAELLKELRLGIRRASGEGDPRPKRFQ